MSNLPEESLDQLVGQAQAGDEAALEAVVRAVQDRVHRLAVRMLVNPEDALEAAQEILILVVTKLSTFRGQSSFNTWVYRVAVNYLLTARKVSAKDQGLTFPLFESDLESGLVADPGPAADDVVMLNQLRVSCTMAMLLCLDLTHRIAYVLGEILELDHDTASQVLEVSKANYRQRLARARRQVVAFTARACGIVNTQAKCTCPRRLPAAMALGRVSADPPLFQPGDAPDYQSVIAAVDDLKGELATAYLQKAMPDFPCPRDLAARIAEIVTLEK